jgi:hypothetical protein
MHYRWLGPMQIRHARSDLHKQLQPVRLWLALQILRDRTILAPGRDHPDADRRLVESEKLGDVPVGKTVPAEDFFLETLREWVSVRVSVG